MVPDIVVLNKNLLYYFKNKVTNMRRPVAGTHKCSWSAQSLPSPRPARKLNCNEKLKVPGEDRVQGEFRKSQLALLPKGAEANAALSRNYPAFFRTFFSDSWQLWLRWTLSGFLQGRSSSLLGEWKKSFGLEVSLVNSWAGLYLQGHFAALLVWSTAFLPFSVFPLLPG